MALCLRADVLTLRDIAMLAKNTYYPENMYYAGTLEFINQVDYEKMIRTVHILPRAKGHYPIDGQVLIVNQLVRPPRGQELRRGRPTAEDGDVPRLLEA